jgi:hypothetical protein
LILRALAKAFSAFSCSLVSVWIIIVLFISGRN